MERFRLDDLEIMYEKNFSSRATRPRIRFSKSRGFIVTVPERMRSSFDIESFLERTSDWLEERASELRDYQEKAPERSFTDGEVISIIGRNLVLRKDNFRGHSIEDGEIKISERYARSQKEVRKAVEKLLRERARKIFRKKAEDFSEKLNVDYNRIYVRNQKTKWGSCSGRKNINLNWRLILGPEKILDYVVAHEITHLKYRDHSDRFWDQLEEIIPDYRKRKKWLEEKSYLLEF